MAGFLFSTQLCRPSSVVAQNRAFKSGVEVVPLTVTVTDRAGRYVPDLTAADFAVFEKGKRQVVSHFAADQVPLDVAFLVDTSSSMRNTLPLAQKGACGLVGRLRAGDLAAVSGIRSNVLLHQSMTPDLARVDAALRSTQADGNTALYDAVYIALRQYQQKRSSASDIRRQVIVLLSDGIDTASHVTFDDLLDVVRAADVTIYVVSLATDPVLVKAVMSGRAVLLGARLCQVDIHRIERLYRDECLWLVGGDERSCSHRRSPGAARNRRGHERVAQIDPRCADRRLVRGDARLRLLPGGFGIVVFLFADAVDRDQTPVALCP